MDKIILREASFKDAKIIFDLSNEYETRQNSINRNNIFWQDHLVWLKRKLQDENYKIYLFFIENVLLGQVKFEITFTSALISVSLDPKFRGKGYAAQILKLGIQYLLNENNSVSEIIALIRLQNEPSIKTFSRVGFTYEKEETINGELFLKYKFKTNYYNK